MVNPNRGEIWWADVEFGAWSIEFRWRLGSHPRHAPILSAARISHQSFNHTNPHKYLIVDKQRIDKHDALLMFSITESINSAAQFPLKLVNPNPHFISLLLIDGPQPVIHPPLASEASDWCLFSILTTLPELADD